MAQIDTLFSNGKLPDGRSASLAVGSGRIVAVLADGEPLPQAGEVVDVGGKLILPGFVEGHIHLDTSFYGDTWKPYKPNTAGFDVRERVAFQMENLKSAAPMAERARSQLELCLSQGTTHMRSHVMVDANLGLSHVEAVLGVVQDYRALIDVELVAFPQSGILSSPGIDKLLEMAIEAGCSVIGGLDPATFDRDIEKHLDVVFAIAQRHRVPVDIHLHDGGTLGMFEIEQICARTEALGLGGRVAVSHAYSLGEISEDLLARTADRLAKAGVAIMTLAPPNGPFPPVAPLRAAGVNVFSGSDNIRDSWWPYGDGDLLRRANMVGHRSGFFTDEALTEALDTVTYAGARALRRENYGLSVGDFADLVLVAAQHVPEAVVAVPPGREVYKRGRLVAAGGKVLRN
jgi:cytosine/creatinine deaminase